MKLLVLIFCILTATTTFASTDLRKVADEYNGNILDVATLIQYVSYKDKAKGESLKNYFNKNGISPTATVSELVAKKDYLIFKNDIDAEFKMKPLSTGGVEITYKNKKEIFKTSMTLEETQQLFQRLAKLSNTTSLIEYFISSARAEGIMDGISIAASGVYASLSMGALYATAFVSDSFNEIKAIPRERREKKLREKVIAACNEIRNGNKVKDASKLRVDLEKLKSEDNCVPYWDSRMYHSCGWYEDKLSCLSTGAPEISDAPRAGKNNSIEKESQTRKNSGTMAK